MLSIINYCILLFLCYTKKIMEKKKYIYIYILNWIKNMNI